MEDPFQKLEPIYRSSETQEESWYSLANNLRMSTLKQLTLDNSTQTAVTEHSTIHRVCDNLACHAVLSDHLAYDNHYALLHKNACSNCAKQFF